MDNAKIYGLCLERLRHQIGLARRREEAAAPDGFCILESYLTGDLEEIIDILELYDIEDRTPRGLREKLDELAYTASVLIRERLSFNFDHEGHLGIYVTLAADLSRTTSPEEAVLAGN